MSTKYVAVASTNSREFVKAILALGAQGATLPDNEGVFKGIQLRCKLEIDETELVPENPILRVIPKDKKNEVVEISDTEMVKPKKKTSIKKIDDVVKEDKEVLNEE